MTTQRVEDLSQNQCSETFSTEELMHQPSMEQKSDCEDAKKDASDEHSFSVDNFYNDKLDFLEMQMINNIMKAAYKEFMAKVIESKAWVTEPPAVGAVEDLQEMFHSPPSHGCTVEFSVETTVLPISASLLISIMMDGELWSSMFSNIICSGSDENDGVLTPLKKFWTEHAGAWEVKLVNAQFRLPAEFLPKWSSRFLRFKTMVMEDTYAIFDVSTDYFKNTKADPTQKIVYKRRPSGVIIRPLGRLSRVIWIENAEVQKIDIPKNMCSTFTPNFPLTAKQWISFISQNLNRRHSRILTSEMFNRCADAPDLLTFGDKLRKSFLETVNSFPSERTRDLFSDDKIRILRDTNDCIIGSQNDYIATSTIHVAETPTRLVRYLDLNQAIFQCTGIKSHAQLKTIAIFFTRDESSCTSLSMKKTENEKDFKGFVFFVQECTENEYCSFILSSQITEADVQLSLLPRVCKDELFLRPCGFAIMPAGPGGILCKESFVTIYLRRELENMEVDQVIEAMTCHMNAVIDRISNTRFQEYFVEDVIEQNIPNP